MKRHIQLFTFSIISMILVISACSDGSKEELEAAQQRIAELEGNLASKDSQIRQLQNQVNTFNSRIEVCEVEKSEIIEKRTIYFDEGGSYSVQVSAWRGEERAFESVDSWKKKGFKYAHVYRSGDDKTGNVWFGVRLGRFSSHYEAMKLSRLLDIDHELRSVVYTIADADNYDPFTKEDYEEYKRSYRTYGN